MVEHQLSPLKQAIIERATSPKNPGEIIDEVVEKGFRESEIRESIWHLIDSQDLELSASRTLMAGAKHPHQLYLIPPTEK